MPCRPTNQCNDTPTYLGHVGHVERTRCRPHACCVYGPFAGTRDVTRALRRRCACSARATAAPLRRCLQRRIAAACATWHRDRRARRGVSCPSVCQHLRHCMHRNPCYGVLLTLLARNRTRGIRPQVWRINAHALRPHEAWKIPHSHLHSEGASGEEEEQTHVLLSMWKCNWKPRASGSWQKLTRPFTDLRCMLAAAPPSRRCTFTPRAQARRTPLPETSTTAPPRSPFSTCAHRPAGRCSRDGSISNTAR